MSVTTGLSAIEVSSVSDSDVLPFPPAVEVTFSVLAGTVTSVDTGVPVGAYEADGSQVDDDLVPFPVGTVLVNDEEGVPQLAGDNVSASPTITVNASQTWSVAEQTLRRESVLFRRPGTFGRFHRPLNWLPYNTIS